MPTTSAQIIVTCLSSQTMSTLKTESRLPMHQWLHHHLFQCQINLNKTQVGIHKAQCISGESRDERDLVLLFKWSPPPPPGTASQLTSEPATTHVIARTVDGERTGLGIAYMEETREHAREIQKKVKEGSKPHRPSSHLSRWIGQTHFLWTRSSSDVGTEGGHFPPESESKKPVSFSKRYVHCRGPGGGPLQSVTWHFPPTATCPPNWRVPSRKEVEAREHGGGFLKKKKKGFLRAPNQKYKKE